MDWLHLTLALPLPCVPSVCHQCPLGPHCCPMAQLGDCCSTTPWWRSHCLVPAPFTAPYLGAAAFAIAFPKLGAVGLGPAAPLAKLGNPTAPPSHGAQTSTSARACPTALGELWDPAGEHGPWRRRKKWLTPSWKIKLQNIVKTKEKNCYFNSSTLQRLYSASRLSSIWLGEFKRSQQTTEYLQPGNKSAFRAQGWNALLKQPVLLVPKTSKLEADTWSFMSAKHFLS